MKNKTQHQNEAMHKDHGSNTGSALAGLLIGGLAGAGAALLLAPQSGKETREQIQQKTIELRDRTTETVEDAVSQVKAKTHQITTNLHDRTAETVEGVKAKTQQIATNLHDKASELQHQGQEIIAEQLDHVSAAAEAGKVALTQDSQESESKAVKNHHAAY